MAKICLLVISSYILSKKPQHPWLVTPFLSDSSQPVTSSARQAVPDVFESTRYLLMFDESLIHTQTYKLSLKATFYHTASNIWHSALYFHVYSGDTRLCESCYLMVTNDSWVPLMTVIIYSTLSKVLAFYVSPGKHHQKSAIFDRGCRLQPGVTTLM